MRKTTTPEPMTRDEAMRHVAHVQAKIDRFIESRRIAEEAFSKLKARSDWPEIAALTGMYEHGTFGDWTC